MKMKDQVCTVEQGKKLKELGVAVESEFIWSINYRVEFVWYINYDLEYYLERNGSERKFHPWYPAYTLAELSAMHIYDDNDRRYFEIEYDKRSGDYHLCENDFGDFIDLGIYSTETHAYAAAMIWMIENKHLRVKDLKL
jgi:hypothetical protein